MFIGSLLSSSVPDRYIRPVIAFVIFASGLKYVGLGTTALGWILCGTCWARRPCGSCTRGRSTGWRPRNQWDRSLPEEPPEPDALLVGEQRS